MTDQISPAAIYERARRLANIAVWTIALQRRRLSASEPEDETFAFRLWADWEFFISSLMRLRRAAALAAKADCIKVQIEEALEVFDRSIPNLQDARNVMEHIDEYALDKGHARKVSRKSLEVGSFDSCRFIWSSIIDLDADAALAASRALFVAIRVAQGAFPPSSKQDGTE